MKRIDPEAFKEAHDLGLNRQELATRFGVTTGSVTRLKKRLGLPLAARGTVDREELAHLATQGWSIKQLAAHYNVNERTISRIKADMGIAGERTSQPISQTKLEQIQAMIEDEAPHSEIIRTLHVDRETIQRYFPGTAWTAQQRFEHIRTLRTVAHFNKARPRTYDPAKYRNAA